MIASGEVEVEKKHLSPLVTCSHVSDTVGIKYGYYTSHFGPPNHQTNEMPTQEEAMLNHMDQKVPLAMQENFLRL